LSFPNYLKMTTTRFTRSECICEMQGLANLLVRTGKQYKLNLGSLTAKINLTIMKKILHIFNDVILPLPKAKTLYTAEFYTSEFYTYLVKLIRDIKYMPLWDSSENIHYIFKELCAFLKSNGAEVIFSDERYAIKTEIDKVLSIEY
jgi:hypothetical protein